ncbi:hypothetical protein TPDSL_40740 (plasmid) [Terrisporobacter petrolearius]|uniref:helix-turn-helix domain-containing protein n=1 Tax=Terrisporobacter petrolearius TaxID=1460447 RepID=UPI0032420073
MKNVGKMIKEERENQKYSIKELSEATGYSERHIGKIEREGQTPSIECLMAIEKALQTTFLTKEYKEFLQGNEKKAIITMLKLYREKFEIDINIDDIMNDYYKYEKIKTRIEYCFKTILRMQKEGK